MRVIDKEHELQGPPLLGRCLLPLMWVFIHLFMMCIGKSNGKPVLALMPDLVIFLLIAIGVGIAISYFFELPLWALIGPSYLIASPVSWLILRYLAHREIARMYGK